MDLGCIKFELRFGSELIAAMLKIGKTAPLSTASS